MPIRPTTPSRSSSHRPYFMGSNLPQEEAAPLDPAPEIPAYAPWPFVGRQDLVQKTASRIRSGRGTILVGGLGRGKTSLASRVLRETADTSFTVKIRGIPVVSAVPYGALAVLLSPLDARDLNHPLLISRQISRILTERADGRRGVLFVDNLQYLDDESADVIARLAMRDDVGLLLACESMSHAPREIAHLWSCGYLARVDVGPLDLDETAELLRQGLGGPICRSAARELWVLSGGNPLFLQILAHEQLSSRNLVRCEWGWVLSAPVEEARPQTADILMSRLERFTAEQLPALELVALSGPLPLELLMKTAGAAEIATLEEEGILAVEEAGEHLTRIADPFVAEVVRRNVAPGHSCELREHLVDMTSGRFYPPINALAFAKWTLDCGGLLEPKLAAAAAKQANDALDPRSALNLLETTQSARADPELAIELIRALIGQGMVTQAGMAVNRLLGEKYDLSLTNWVDLTLSCVLLSRDEPNAEGIAKEALVDVRQRLVLELRAGAAPAEVPELLNKVELVEIGLAVHDGRHAEILGRLERLFHDLSSPDAFRSAIGVWLSEALAVTGHQEDGAKLAKELLKTAENGTADPLMESVRANVFCSFLLAGRWNECSQFIRNRIGSTVDGGEAAADEVLEGLLQAHCGHPDEALKLLLPCVDQLRARSLQDVFVLALAGSAYAYSIKDDPYMVGTFLNEINLNRTSESWAVRRAVDYFTTLSTARLAPREDVVERLLAHADDCRSQRAPAYELFSLSAAVRLGHHAAAERLVTTAASTQGPFARLCEVYGRGIKSGNPKDLLQAARMAKSIGHDQWCRDAAESVLSETGGHTGSEQLKDAARLIHTCRAEPLSRSHWSDIPPLTPREREIASSASRGATNREIAGSLGLSPRTIEGHLHQIYRKLHVSGRAGLRELPD